jgi:inorganic pyrophosphatase
MQRRINYAKRFLGKTVTIKIDRPIGSKHPRCDIHYLVNYGYVPNTCAPDGDEIDGYVLGVFIPIRKFIGKCIAIIHRTNDDDDKLVVVPKGKNFTNKEIKVLTEFQEQYFKSKIIRR